MSLGEPLLQAGVGSWAGHHPTPRCGPGPREPSKGEWPFVLRGLGRPLCLFQAVEAWLRQGQRVPDPQAQRSHSFPDVDLPLFWLLLCFQRTSLGSARGPICP